MYASPNHARVMLWCGVAMCLAGVASIAAAELFMPDNYHGKKGVITFYRCFGPWLIAWGAVAWDAQRALRRDHPE